MPPLRSMRSHLACFGCSYACLFGRRNMLLLCAVWITLCFSFYGLSLWLPNVWSYLKRQPANSLRLNLVLQKWCCSRQCQRLLYLVSWSSGQSSRFSNILHFQDGTHCGISGNIVSAYSVELIGRARTLAASMVVSAGSIFFIFAVKSLVGTIVCGSLDRVDCGGPR